MDIFGASAPHGRLAHDQRPMDLFEVNARFGSAHPGTSARQQHQFEQLVTPELDEGGADPLNRE